MLPDRASRATAAEDQRCARPYRRPGVLDQMVLALLKKSGRPLTAHDIARGSHRRGTPLTATQVYRVLDRLGGRVQRVELLSAWILAEGEPVGFLVCRSCREVTRFRVPGQRERLLRISRSEGFAPTRQIVEAIGVCPGCAGAADSAAAGPSPAR